MSTRVFVYSNQQTTNIYNSYIYETTRFMGEKLLNLYFFCNIYAEFQISLYLTRIHQSHIKTSAGLHKNYDLVNNIMVRHV